MNLPAPAPEGSMRIFQVKGITVYLHWAWLLVAYYFISRTHIYESMVFSVLEYVGLFAIVLLHEFGHAFATRQVGGTAERILLWPFGGIAFVNAPPRPAAHLWSIAAGPLVNVALIPVFLALSFLIPYDGSDATKLLYELGEINFMLLLFNLLPVYPLDGGQILQSLLWFPLGWLKATLIASGLGLVLGALLGYYLYTSSGSLFHLLLAGYLLLSTWRTFTLCFQQWKAGAR